LLERRCQFSGMGSEGIRGDTGSSILSNHDEDDDKIKNGATTTNVAAKNSRIAHENYSSSTLIQVVDPILVRRALFEESSKSGFALTEFERERIVEAVASNLKVSALKIKELMWSDLEDN